MVHGRKNGISIATIVTIVGITVLGLLSVIGQLRYPNSVSVGTAILFAVFEVSLLSVALMLAIKAKIAHNKYGKWKKVEAVSVLAYVIIAFAFSPLLNIEAYKSPVLGWCVFVVLHLLISFSYFAANRHLKCAHSVPYVNRNGGFSINADGMITRKSSPNNKNNGGTKRKNDSSYSPFPPVPFADLFAVYSSVFAPAEVKSRSHMLVQVYLHLYEETEMVKSLAQESDKEAERRDYIPLQCKLKKGDEVDVQLNIYGETLLMSDKKRVIWQGSFTKCSFDYFVPKDIDVDELSCVALLFVNGVPVGEMRFITQIVEVPRQLNPEILAQKYRKVFISYAHQDESKVKFLHEGLELGSVPHFFDRNYLKAGDVFPQVIQDYINSADLFILCWSENASKSEYVQKERLQALGRAFPQVKPEQAAKLRIYPMSIEPHAELPGDMKNYYHFGEI